jgi:SPX domain protein involved in polyphosphate accumulation
LDKKYVALGIKGLLTDQPMIIKSRIITSEIHQGLKMRINSSTTPFLGYWEAKSWVYKQYGMHFKYYLLRHYVILHFKTNLKNTQKSHYKKDVEAEKLFKTP